MGCSSLSDAGLISGLWDGLTALVTLLANIFWNLELYNKCQSSWFYDAGFMVSVSLVAMVAIRVPLLFALLFVVLMAAKIIVIIIGPILWGMLFAAGCLAVYGIYHAFFRRTT